MGIHSKPSDKEKVKDLSLPGHICSVCGAKYRLEISQRRCQQWHEATQES